MKKSGLGFTQVFWGNGKGKTTSALGTALRACGNGYKVHLVQFMKNGTGNPEIDHPGEIRALEKFENFSHKRFGSDGWVIGKPTQNQINSVKEALNYVISSLNKDYDIVIADEILYAIQLGLLTESEVLKLIQNKPKDKELILTGSHKPYPKIFELANLVTEVKKHKHPFDSGFVARKGLEY
jgi:cob(I)alamin adenosyltransferase